MQLHAHCPHHIGVPRPPHLRCWCKGGSGIIIEDEEIIIMGSGVIGHTSHFYPDVNKGGVHGPTGM